MAMFNKLKIFLSILFFTFIFIDFSNAYANFTVISPSNNMVQRASNNFFNVSIGATNENITWIQFNFTGALDFDPNYFVVDSNGTNSNASFSNNTFISGGGGGGQTVMLTYTNRTSAGIIQNTTTKNFWFNITTRNQASAVFQMNILAMGISGTSNISIPSFGFSFSFSGYVKNETGDYQNSTNVSIYEFTQGNNGPPTESIITSSLTNENGIFILSGINASGGKNYKLRMIYYNQSDSSQALKIGTTLPQFPAEMYYPQSFGGDIAQYEFMRPPTLNGTTFYLGPAATINVTATNGSVSQLFGYMLNEQQTGFPMISNAMENVSWVQMIVPISRTYSLMLIRANQQFSQYSVCDGSFMNNTACFAPPKSNSTLNPTFEGQNINVNMDLRVNRIQMYGCINAIGNTTNINNITAILPRMLPWTGFVPPMRPDTQDINLSSALQLNYSDSRCPGSIARYNISLLNSNYLIEFVGRNSTFGSGGEYLGAFQNVSYQGQSVGTNNYINITLQRLSGSFIAASSAIDVNNTKFLIRIQNSTGGAITQDKPHVDIHITNPVFGELTFIVEDFTNGTFALSLPLNSSAKAKIFSNNAPPKEKTLNLSQSELNITLTTMTNGDAGFKKINSSGGFEMMNISDSSFAINMRFLRSSTSCNVINPSTSCELTTMTGTGFNPFKAMVAGKINMEMKITSSNVVMTFYNFDMLAAKQPPMESVMNNQASSGATSARPIWEFGSFVPADVYDYAIIGMPYSDSNIDDSSNINISLSNLYDENWNVVWNGTRGDTQGNITTNIDEYLGNSNNRSYNSTGYRNFLNTLGISCSKTDPNLTGNSPTSYCYVNTSSNIMYIRVPHFSGVAPLVTGNAPVSTTTTSSSSGNEGGTGASVSPANPNSNKTDTNKTHGKESQNWTKITPGSATIMKVIDKDLGIKQISILVNNPAQNVQITITKYEGLPANVTVNKTGKVYKYLQIHTENLTDKINKTTIRLSVDKKWMLDNNIQSDRISLFKFYEDSKEWKEIPTIYGDFDELNNYYEADLTSFSYFIIGEKEIITPSTNTITENNNYNNLYGYLMIIILILGLSIFIYFFRKSSFYHKRK